MNKYYFALIIGFLVCLVSSGLVMERAYKKLPEEKMLVLIRKFRSMRIVSWIISLCLLLVLVILGLLGRPYLFKGLYVVTGLAVALFVVSFLLTRKTLKVCDMPADFRVCYDIASLLRLGSHLIFCLGLILLYSYWSSYQYAKKAKIAYDKQQYDEAIQNLDKALEKEPNVAQYYVFRGISKYKNNDLVGACADWKQAKELEENTDTDQYLKDYCH